MTFTYQNKQMMAEEVSLSQIAKEVGTPCFVYSQKVFTEKLESFNTAFGGKAIVCFAVKSSANLTMLNLVAQGGQGADIVSGGELFKAQKAGINPGKIVFSGVGKTKKEMAEALDAGIMMFNIESEAELERLNSVAAEKGKKAPIAVRVNPNVDPGTHPYIATGLKESKFGVAADRALDLYRRAAKMENIEVKGIACHIGSQLTTIAPFLAAAEKLQALALTLLSEGFKLQYFDMGGGLGVCYNDETPPSLAEYADGLKKIMEPLGPLTLVLEPGRYIAANSAVLLTEVQYNKSNGDRQFVVVDAAMNDLARPSLYGSFHGIKPLKETDAPEIVVDVVGPVCESGDFLAKGRSLAKVESGDLLAAMSAGAYGYTMSSTYNARPRAAEVLVTGSNYKIIRDRETYEDLIRGEKF